MSLNSMVTALYEDLQQGRPINNIVPFVGIKSTTVTFDKKYSMFIVVAGANSSHIYDMKFNGVAIPWNFAEVGDDSGNKGLFYQVIKRDIQPGDVFSVYSNNSYIGGLIIY